MAYYLEPANLVGILYMGTNTGTCIIIPYPHYAESLGGILREFAKVHDSSSLFAIHEFDGDIMILRNLLIDLCFYPSQLLGSRLCIKDIVAFGLFLLHMSIPRTRTSEHLHHSGVQQMLAAMHMCD